jgi:hypothetical protein
MALLPQGGSRRVCHGRTKRLWFMMRMNDESIHVFPDGFVINDNTLS